MVTILREKGINVDLSWVLSLVFQVKRLVPILFLPSSLKSLEEPNESLAGLHVGRRTNPCAFYCCGRLNLDKHKMEFTAQ